jgi:hypothetical protein
MKAYGEWRYSSTILDLGTQKIAILINLDFNFMQEGIVIKGYGPILNSLIKCYN